MTRDEQDRIDGLSERIDGLIEKMAEWRNEILDSRRSAIQEHADNCEIREEVRNMSGKIDSLVKIQTKRDAVYEENARRRAARARFLKEAGMVATILGTIAGAVTTVIVAL